MPTSGAARSIPARSSTLLCPSIKSLKATVRWTNAARSRCCLLFERRPYHFNPTAKKGETLHAPTESLHASSSWRPPFLRSFRRGPKLPLARGTCSPMPEASVGTRPLDRLGRSLSHLQTVKDLEQRDIGFRVLTGAPIDTSTKEASLCLRSSQDLPSSSAI